MNRGLLLTLALLAGCAGSPPVTSTVTQITIKSNPNTQPLCSTTVTVQCQQSMEFTSNTTGQTWTFPANQLSYVLSVITPDTYTVKVMGQIEPNQSIAGVPATVTVP